MAQVYQFVDDNGVTRLFAEIVPDPAGTPFNGGTITAPLIIESNSTTDPALVIKAASGSSAAGTTLVQFQREDGSEFGRIDVYGEMTLKADTIDATNGGGSYSAAGAAGQSFNTIADLGAGTGQTAIGPLSSAKVGFFGTSPVAQPAAPVTLNDVIAALQALGLVAT